MITIALSPGRAETRRARVRRRHSPAAATPWGRRDRAVLVVSSAFALIGLMNGWLGVSDTVALDSQARWLGLGIGALMLGGFGMLAWLLAGLRNVAVLRREALAETDRRFPAPRTMVVQAPTSGHGAITGMSLFHTRDCPMLAGKHAEFGDAATHTGAGRRPCGICLPASVTHE